MDTQFIIVCMIVGVAIAYTLRGIYRSFRRANDCSTPTGCAGCSGCPLARKEPEKEK